MENVEVRFLKPHRYLVIYLLRERLRPGFQAEQNCLCQVTKYSNDTRDNGTKFKTIAILTHDASVTWLVSVKKNSDSTHHFLNFDSISISCV